MILKVSNAVLCFLLLCTLAEILAPPAEAAQARMNLRWGSVRTAYPLFTDATNFGAFVRAFKTALKPGELVLVISRHPWQSAFKDLMTKLANVRTQLCGSPVGTGDESYCGAAK